jgi:phenylalanyl-tRNA synthetase beta chain
LQPDSIFEIGLTPNRADAASHFGTARDLTVLLDSPIKFPDTSSFKVDNENLHPPISVEVEDTKACPRYSGVTISGITVADSPEWLQERLKSVGLMPINNVVDITNYVLHGLGQPLHAFDADKIAGNKVIVKTLPTGTKFTTLDEVERELNETDLMICNSEEPMCIAGVFGGVSFGVSESTKNIFLESAYFSPMSVRKTSMKHSLKTDAAFRYERGTDPNITVEALKVAALLIKEIAGGEISSEVVDIYPNPIKHFEVEVAYKNVDRLIGKKIDRNRIKQILQGLEMEILKDSDDGITLSVPPYRVDVQREADIIEDILRIYGFNDIELSENLGADSLANFPKIDRENLKSEVSELLSGNGAYEIFANSLTKPEYAASLSELSAEGNVEMLNPLSSELTVMRQSMIFSGLEVIAHNVNRRQKEVKIYEFGKTYHKLPKQEGDDLVAAKNKYDEKEKLTVFVTGSKQAESWISPTEKANFHSLSKLVQLTLQKLGFTNYQSTDVQNSAFQYGIQLEQNKKVIAQLGMLKPSVCKLADVKQEVFYAEIDWAYFVKKGKPKVTFQEISKFPEVRRDLSLVLDKSVSFEQVRQLAFRTERKLLQSVNVFSVYEGESIGEDKKSYALSFILQDASKTLNDKAIDKTMGKFMNQFERELGAVIRK